MNIRAIEMRFLDKLFDMESGYVLDFSNRTFSEFFEHEVGLDIYDDAYALNGTSKAKRLRTFLQIGQQAAVTKALHALWEYREATRRQSGDEETVLNARDELSSIIERLGGSPLRHIRRPASTQSVTPDANRLSRLQQEFSHLSNLDRQPRGYAFEKFLKNLFDAYGLEARNAFRITGEQIDGSFQLAGETYLLEARWQNAQADAASLRAFHGKVEDKVAWARGLFVSYAGYTEPGLAAFGGKKIVLMDGLDLHDTLRRGLSVAEVISLKVRRAAETGQVFIRVRDLTPE